MTFFDPGIPESGEKKYYYFPFAHTIPFAFEFLHYFHIFPFQRFREPRKYLNKESYVFLKISLPVGI